LGQVQDTETWPYSNPIGSESVKILSLISELSKCIFTMQQYSHSRNNINELILTPSLYDLIEFKLNNIGKYIVLYLLKM